MSTLKKMITLQTSDGNSFEVDDCADNGVPLANVTSKILAKVIDYCKEHVVDVDDSLSELKKFDADFMNIDQSKIFELILAANYLDIKSLLDLTCQTIADDIAGKSVVEVPEKYGIENDSTPEEDEEIRKENQWAFG